MSVIYRHEGGKVISHHSERGASTTMMFNVPTGKKWELIAGYAERDVNATFDLELQDEDDEVIWAITQIAAGVSNLFIPRDIGEAERQIWRRLILGPSWRILYEWGVAQTSPEVACWVVET